MVRRPRNALERLNHILGRLKIDPVDSLPLQNKAVSDGAGKPGKLMVLRQGIPVFIGYFLFMSSFYFLLSWLPKLLVSAGQSERLGITALTLVNVGGITGALAVGALTWRFGVKRVTASLSVATGIGIGLTGLFISNATATVLVAAVLGFATYACMVGLYSVAAATFPAALRVTGISIALTFGKIGSIIAPYVAGILLDTGRSPGQLCVIYAFPALLAGLALMQTSMVRSPPDDPLFPKISPPA
jgi:MFS family permease